MKRIIISFLFVLSITTSLFAFENEYFRVNDEGLIFSTIADTYSFKLDLTKNSDYSCPDQKNPDPPFITVNTTPNNGEHLNFTEDEAYKVGKASVDRLRNSSIYWNKGYKLGRTSVERFGENKALYYELTSYSGDVRVYIFTGEKYKYTIGIHANKGDNFCNTYAYRSFVASFVKLNEQPKSKNKNKDTLFSMPEHKPNPYRRSGNSRRHLGGRSYSSTSNGFAWDIFVYVILFLAIVAWRIKSSLLK